MKKIVLFGDSITDMFRNRDADENGMSYGFGYPAFVKERLIKEGIDASLINRGCGGEKTTELIARLKTDVLDLKPDIVTILVGVNDVWHKMLLNPDGTRNGNSIEQYEKNYIHIIETIQKELPNTKIFLFGIFYLEVNDGNAEQWKILKEVPEYDKVIQKIAKNKNLVYTPLQPAMDQRAKELGITNVLYDGVHPNIAGAVLIADKWTETVFPYIK